MVMTRSRGRSESDLSASKEALAETPTKKDPVGKGATDETRKVSSNRKAQRSPKKAQPIPESHEDESSDSSEDEEEQPTQPTEQQRKVAKESSSTDLTTTTTTMTKKDNNNKKHPKEERNELTKLIPGYTAPMKLNTSSLNKFRPAGGIQALQKRAERTDASTRSFVVEAASSHTSAMQKKPGSLPSSYMQAYSSFKKGTKRAPDTSAGRGWFNMNPTPMTEELKADLAVVRNRAYLDPKKFYKSSDKAHAIVQLGTVIEGASEFHSSRLTKKQRRTNITDEIMADKSLADYTVNKFKDMNRERGAKADKRKRKSKRGGRKFY